MEKNTKDLLRKMGFSKELERLEKGHCPFCDSEIDPDGFRDPLSKREWEISGMCQKCQDSTFGESVPPDWHEPITEPRNRPMIYDAREDLEENTFIGRCLHCGNDIFTPCPICEKDLNGQQTCCPKCYPCSKQFKESLEGFDQST
jgi:hypothetical protein